MLPAVSERIRSLVAANVGIWVFVLLFSLINSQTNERNLFFRGMTAWLGFKHVQIEFVVNKRFNGDSKWSFFKLIRLAVTALTAFSSLPLHLVTILGFFFLIFAILLGLNTLSQKIAGIAVSGFTTVILLQLIIGSLLMICLGIIGEYIARVYQRCASCVSA